MPSSVYSSLSSAPPTGGTKCARVTPFSSASTQWPHSESTDATVQLETPSGATAQLSSADSSDCARSFMRRLASPSRNDCTSRSPPVPSAAAGCCAGKATLAVALPAKAVLVMRRL